jgi:tRNA threonylcarbamoyladenosine biosynthesis protein TsaB
MVQPIPVLLYQRPMTNRSTAEATVRPASDARPAGNPHGPILAIETGGRACSVAIYAGPRDWLAHESEQTDHGHAVMVMPMIERARAKAGLQYADFSRIAVAVGPGSFTGIRVGLAAALGLSLASGVPAVGISSFLTVAQMDQSERRGRRLFALLDSRREEPFLVEVDAELAFLAPPSAVSLEQLDAILAPARPLILAGDAPALARYSSRGGITPMQSAPDAMSVARLAADPARRYDLAPKPVYARAPDVTLPKPA